MSPDEQPSQEQPRHQPRYGRGRRRTRGPRPQPPTVTETVNTSIPEPASVPDREPAPAPEPEPEPEKVEVPVPAPTGTSGFMCDAMLGRLAREMRVLGMDVEYNRTISGMQAYKAARAAGRTLLTRNKRMTSLPGVVFITSQEAPAQIAQVKGEPPPPVSAATTPAPVAQPAPRPAPRPEKPPQEQPFGRCLECNSALEKISRDQARPSVPFFIYQIHHDFRGCPKCRKVFWPGSHVEQMAQRVGPPPRPRRSFRSGPRRQQNTGDKK